MISFTESILFALKILSKPQIKCQTEDKIKVVETINFQMLIYNEITIEEVKQQIVVSPNQP